MMNPVFSPRGCADQTPLGSLPRWFSALLRLRGIETEEEARRFLSPSLEDLCDPFLLPGMDRAVRLIRSALEEKRGIMIFGDYDADGVCATSILLGALTEMFPASFPPAIRTGTGSTRTQSGRPRKRRQVFSSPWTAASPAMTRWPWPGSWGSPLS